ncbi:MAG: hypothetical protein WC529_00870 [Candidatus Margulisiibacteriota bacterium]
MKKLMTGLLIGAGAGLIDITPMLLAKMNWDANLSAFSLWVVVGFFVAAVDLNIQPVLKGLLIAFLTLLPSAVLIAGIQPVSLIPVTVMTLILGSLVGFLVGKYAK